MRFGSRREQSIARDMHFAPIPTESDLAGMISRQMAMAIMLRWGAGSGRIDMSVAALIGFVKMPC